MGLQKYGMYKNLEVYCRGSYGAEYKFPAAKGDRSILCHLGCSESGLLEIVCFYFEVQSQISLQIITRK